MGLPIKPCTIPNFLEDTIKFAISDPSLESIQYVHP
jgi:hypothetical protein